MELNRTVMLARWQALAAEIAGSGDVYIMEGCFLHALDRYLLESAWNMPQIQAYFDQIIDILRPLNPLIVLLVKSDIRASFERAFKARGDWWRNLVLSEPEPFGYFATHPYTGDESIYADAIECQNAMRHMHAQLHCAKAAVDTSAETWGEYVRQIVELAGYTCSPCEPMPIVDSDKYSGTYGDCDGATLWKISRDAETGEFFTSLFWPYMPMRYIGSDRFELISFPVELQFEFFDSQRSFRVIGSYDWELNGRVFLLAGG